MNETSRKLAVDLFRRPTLAPVSLDADALANALQFDRRLAEAVLAPDSPQRRRIWELSSNLHCSIIGTCFSTSELRQLLVKLSVAGAAKTGDHDLHGQAVGLASNRTGGAKHLQKALDRRHRAAINQFDKAKSESDVRELWEAALSRGDIPGAYWATLTHPKTSHALARDVFAEVHMLSHLVGAANRADIRRLRQLATEKAELEEKVVRQQTRLRDAILEQDTTIRNLGQALAQRLRDGAVAEVRSEGGADTDRSTLEKVIGDLERQLTAETHRRTRAEDRQAALQETLTQSESARQSAQEMAAALRSEIVETEQAIAALTAHSPGDAMSIDLGGRCILYVGGKDNLVPPMKTVTERCAAQLLHHDGGVEASTALLPGLIARADLVLFPVDCVSHEAATAVKRICRQAGKRYMPLRSAGLTSYVAALRSIAAPSAT